ncbi:MAG: chemotaxis protein CheD [Deltaproteobacteria bacterium]|nr:chemotaxis protein CheD [Deltaproteobacteria bacterium]MBW2129469.1 chemotaxis protein CheD [Deltaproteobacteria bacterium]MBW2304437.1 chemotaxis protein CheD [Deltaproteobacteria bacterium]
MPDISVKLLQYAIAQSGRLRIDHIGSGVGVILYSAAQKTGAGLHILAPKSGKLTAKSPVMYANTAIPYILDQLRGKGVNPPFSVAIAGGATLLGKGAAINSGQNVVEAVKDALKKANLGVKIEQTGGNRVRSMILDIDAGKIKIA